MRLGPAVPQPDVEKSEILIEVVIFRSLTNKLHLRDLCQGTMPKCKVCTINSFLLQENYIINNYMFMIITLPGNHVTR